MSVRDFELCTIPEFEAVVKAWYEKEEARMQTSWETTRMLAAITIQPHIKKKITPAKLLPFPWDKTKEEASPMSRNEHRRRFYELTRKTSAPIESPGCNK